MGTLVDNLPQILGGFRTTLLLLVSAGVLSVLWGTVLVAMRLSPVPVLRWAGGTYVTVFRNTPLVVLFILVTQGVPTLGVNAGFELLAVATLSLYTSAFICEALRSGVNAVAVGQSEAARALGMTFGQSLSLIVLPQAVRTVIPPVASILIALTKNTAIAEVFGVTEATYQLDELVRKFPGSLWWLFFGIAAGYIVIVLVISGVAQLLERRLRVLR